MKVSHNFQFTKPSYALIPYMAIIFNNYTRQKRIDFTMGFLNIRFDLRFIIKDTLQ